jgi:hypothetical protein
VDNVTAFFIALSVWWSRHRRGIWMAVVAAASMWVVFGIPLLLVWLARS